MSGLSITQLMRLDKERKKEEAEYDKQRKTRAVKKKKTEFQRRREKVMEDLKKKKGDEKKPAATGTARVVSRKGMKRKKKAVKQVPPSRTVQRTTPDSDSSDVNIEDVPWEERAAFKARKKAAADREKAEEEEKSKSRHLVGYSSEERATPANSIPRAPATPETKDSDPPVQQPSPQASDKGKSRPSRPSSAVPTLPPIPEEPEPNTSQSTVDVSTKTVDAGTRLTSINLASPSRDRSVSRASSNSPCGNPNQNVTPTSVMSPAASQARPSVSADRAGSESVDPQLPPNAGALMDIDENSPAFSRVSSRLSATTGAPTKLLAPQPELPDAPALSKIAHPGITIQVGPRRDDDSDSDTDGGVGRISITPGARRVVSRSISRDDPGRKRSWRVASSSPSASITDGFGTPFSPTSSMDPFSMSWNGGFGPMPGRSPQRKRPKTITAGELRRIFEKGVARFSHFERADLERPPTLKTNRASLKDLGGTLEPVKRTVTDGPGNTRSMLDLTEFRMKEPPKRKFVNVPPSVTNGGRSIGGMRSDHMDEG